MILTADASCDQVTLSEFPQWGGLKRPLRTITIAEAIELMDDLRDAIEAARASELETKKSRLIALQAEVARLEKATQ
jgi:hypothetical protein